MKVSDFEVGHFIAHSKGGSDHHSNFMPICSKCNKCMGTISIAEYNDLLEVSGNTPLPLKRQIDQYCNYNEPLISKTKTLNKTKNRFCCFT